jgi:hypothetical protein
LQLFSRSHNLFVHFQKQVHEYFERKASEWSIIGFLNTCNLELYSQKIECYLISLELIANAKTGINQRREKAQELLNLYKEASIGVFVCDLDFLKYKWRNRDLRDRLLFKSLRRVTKAVLGHGRPSRLPDV